MYQKVGKVAYKADLSNIQKLDEHLKNPHRTFKTIHVAGTNGKGSTSHMIASILQEAGYKVGLYTSPHLKDFRERIRINGKAVSKQFVRGFVHRNWNFFETNSLSFFEMTVGMAFDYFAKKQVDIAVIEVGLGGRLDSTNIITPEVSVITNIGFDHTAYLGDTLPLIAAEKAGIIKKDIPVVIGELQEETIPIFRHLASERNAPMTVAETSTSETYKSDLLGNYQEKNCKTAIAATYQLANRGFKINNTHIKNGLSNVLKNTNLQGRWQVLQQKPKIICDTAHNKEGLSLVLNQLRKENYQTLHIVLGIVKDKNLSDILPLFPKSATYYFCSPKIPRALDTKTLHKEAKKSGLTGSIYESVPDAFHNAKDKAKSEDVVFVGGSTFVVAEVI
ncbi:bifunctional folylpolyglutamate synthase/dihydrofolate synthase [Spongiivirga citrea]|uniref:Dihydrofolate synthase/folylpolyglutamate synthase n=1 Tax=Spongiivirga citrea TaxID=1481457 RepID=A0A6M0CNX9_9FLAO|nr:folylpolyglutamate synthase/dihydrofolate synthase family protein [Spongiivirga citrea]NER18653.1 bifunctional folylpolyglutamate synthase/dihydrofolate synthase [Spongiivirga citrea]